MEATMSGYKDSDDGIRDGLKMEIKGIPRAYEASTSISMELIPVHTTTHNMRRNNCSFDYEVLG